MHDGKSDGTDKEQRKADIKIPAGIETDAGPQAYRRMKMAGILYGVGVGPGDPEYMTLKAVRLIRENEVILRRRRLHTGLQCRQFRSWQIRNSLQL